MLPEGFESSPPGLSQAGCDNLVSVESLQVISPIVIGSVLLGVHAILRDGCRI